MPAVALAATFHDLGKLDPDNQAILSSGNSRVKLPVNHCDAGTAHLWDRGQIDAATLVYSHHLGLFSKSEETKKGNQLFLRDPAVVQRTLQNLGSYVTEHNRLLPTDTPGCLQTPSKWSGLTRRIALSCLVDGDWSDTAIYFRKERDRQPTPPRWKERLEALHRYVSRLPEGETERERERNRLRRRLYEACRKADTSPSICTCEAPVGTGKTTALMAHLLRVAMEHNLRHIFVVLPYTNIIKQSVEIYREALRLPGEIPEEVIAEHHHLADFKDLDLRGLSELWQAPIVVTTAVQFFETLGHHVPARLRKLNQVPRSAVLIDEAHAAIPASLWPQNWRWLSELVHSWGCHVVLASGSLVRFWDNKDFLEINPPPSVRSLVPSDLANELAQEEHRRVRFPIRQPPLDRFALIDLILAKPGPRLVIMNTVQSAAVIAYEMMRRKCNVLHLSTALCPADRDPIVDAIRERLRSKSDTDWTLVATSCVEAGVDLDFKTAFRESASVCSLLQTAGRVNRHGKERGCEVLDFRTNDKLLNLHPAFERSRRVLEEMYDEGLLGSAAPDEAASQAFMRELRSGVLCEKAKRLVKAEKDMEYREVSTLNRVIDADTRLVVVRPDIVQQIKGHKMVSSRELMRHSIQMWANRIESLRLEPLGSEGELFSLGSYEYDPQMLGYMAGIIPLIYEDQEGGFVV